MDIKCKYLDQGWAPFFEYEYTCEIERKIIPETTLKFNLVGSHTLKRSNEYVDKLRLYKCVVVKIPHDLSRIFSNLTSLKLSKCNLKEISRKDLRNLPKLRDLRIENDLIQNLPGDLIDDLKNLEVLSFKKNKIRYINPAILENFAKLKFLNLSKNVAINLIYNPYFDDSITIEKISLHILEKCKPPQGSYEVYERPSAYFEGGVAATSETFDDFVQNSSINHNYDQGLHGYHMNIHQYPHNVHQNMHSYHLSLHSYHLGLQNSENTQNLSNNRPNSLTNAQNYQHGHDSTIFNQNTQSFQDFDSNLRNSAPNSSNFGLNSYIAGQNSSSFNDNSSIRPQSSAPPLSELIGFESLGSSSQNHDFRSSNQFSSQSFRPLSSSFHQDFTSNHDENPRASAPSLSNHSSSTHNDPPPAYESVFTDSGITSES